jgi:hypothetical protein
MENRERDRVSQRTTPTEAGELNRRTEEERGREQNPGTNADFGQKIAQAEELEPKSDTGGIGDSTQGRH